MNRKCLLSKRFRAPRVIYSAVCNQKNKKADKRQKPRIKNYAVKKCEILPGREFKVLSSKFKAGISDPDF